MVKRVILEGCNGEWAQECYLPVLIRKAVGGKIELCAVDIEDKIELNNPEIERLWQVAQSNNRALYLNKSKDIQRYNELSGADYVFIVTPDRFHCEIARFWLDGLTAEGKILIEKPLDACAGSALRLKEKIEGKKGKEAIFAFDHYLASTHPFLQNKASYLTKIGKIQRIKFHILEPAKIPPKREKALDKGIIFDLFCHVLALTCAVINQNLTCSAAKLQTVKLEDVKAARYVGCPISGETFAWIKFIVNHDIKVVSVVGKGVGSSKDKFMRLWGPNGKIELDIRSKGNKFFIFDSQGRQQKQGRLNSKHVESFLEGILQAKEYPLSIPGVLSFDTALRILEVLDEAKGQIDKMPEYRCNESISEISERLGEELN